MDLCESEYEWSPLSKNINLKVYNKLGHLKLLKALESMFKLTIGREIYFSLFEIIL